MPDASSLDRIVMAGVDVKDGDTILIASAGEFVKFENKDKTTRTRLKIEVQCVDKRIKELTLNETSRRALINGYGKTTEDWVGMPALATVATQNVGGEMKKVLYLNAIKGAERMEIVPLEEV
jgi:hypothetical protein